MHIILAEPRGFCAGVNMAIEALEGALRAFGPPVYVYHEIVHNKWVVNQFRQKGVVFVDDLDMVPEAAVLLYSAHGVPPDVRRRAAERNLRVIDATCPLVTKVHREAIHFAQQGYTIFLIGHAGHDEVIGTQGEAPQAIRLIQSVAEAGKAEAPNPERVAFLTQTTLSVDDTARISDCLRRRFPGIVGPPSDDICYATQNRQEAVRRLSAEADVVLIVGSQNSSNSRRLAEIAQEKGVRSYLVDGPEMIEAGWFCGGETVLISAGASAPESLVQGCVKLLQERFGATVETRTIRREQIRFPLPLPTEKGTLQ